MAVPSIDTGSYILMVNDLKTTRGPIPAEDITNALLERNMWAFTGTAPLIRKLKENDRFLIYMAGRKRAYFVATGRIAGPVKLVEGEDEAFLRSLGLGIMRYVVRIKDVERFAQPVPIKPLIDRLNFITAKHNYGLHMRFSVVRIFSEDFDIVLQEATALSG